MENLVTREYRTPQTFTARRVRSVRVLVTGADGYIGSVLCPLFVERGYDVVGLDTGFYQAGWLYHDGKDRPRVLTRDVRTLAVRDLEGYDAVVHLAELSNDPLCEHDPEKTFAINHRGSVALARKSKAAGVSRFVYASSCSVYGAAADGIRTEESEPNPQTAYAQCKMLVEHDVGALADDGFSPVFLRNGTAFGASPRMRFDIVVNNLAGLAWTTGRIAMTSDGTPWRPLVHVQDIAGAIVATIEAPRDTIANQIFNVGAEKNNYQVREIAEAIADTFPDCEISFGRNDGDNRSYRVSFDKIRERLPHFRCRWDVRDGARQLRALFEHIGLTDELFKAQPFTRVRQLQSLVRTRQLDSNLYWGEHDF